MKYRMLMIAGLACAPLVAACSTDAAETADAQYNTEVIAAGVYEVGDADHDDLDVAAGQIYAVNGWGRTSVEVFDLETRQLKASFDANPDFPPIAFEELPSQFDDYVFEPRFEMQGVQVDEGSEIVVFGVRNEHFTISDGGIGPLPPRRESFVVQGLSEDGSEVNWSLSLDLRGADQNNVQIPSLSAFVEGDTIAITYSQLDGPRFVVTVPRPDGHETYQLVERDDIDLPAAPLTYLSSDIRTPRGVGASSDGKFLIAASDGLFVADDGGAERILDMPFGDDFYLTDVRAKDGHAYVADLYGYLHVVDANDGTLISTIELEVEGRSIDIEGNKLIIADTEAFQVLDIDDLPQPVQPIDDGGEDTDIDDTDDDGGGWCWFWWC